MTDWRALCEELVEALDGWHQAVFETGISWVRPDETYLIDRARAALAAEPDGPAVPEGREPASVVGEPSDEELRKLAAAEMDNAPNWEEPEYSYESGDPFPYEAPGVAWVNFARAVLARWGRPAPAPAGEVAYAADVRRMCDIILGNTFGNEELDSLALLVGHYPDVLNASPAPAGAVGEQPALPAEGEGLTDTELFRIASDCQALYIADDVDYDNCSEVVAAMRAAIAADRARYSHQPAPPDAGEVGELVEWLQCVAEEVRTEDYATIHSPDLPARAADLLEQRHPAPVPVSERPWEREGWCDKRGMCWAWNWGICNWWEWVDSKLISYSSGDYTHCLPAHALPIPHQQKDHQ